MKKIVLLIIGFISLAHGELFVGDFNKPLEFDIKTAGYYKIELEANVLYNEIYGGEDWEIDLSTAIDATVAQNLYFVVKAAYGKRNEKNTTDIYRFKVGHHTIAATVKVGGNHPERVSADKTAWKYTVRSAEEIDYRNSIGDLQNKITTLQSNLDDQGSSTAASLATQSKQLSDLSTDLNTLKSNILSSNSEMKEALLEKIEGLQKQLVDTEEAAFAAIGRELSKIEGRVDDQGAATATSLAVQSKQLSDLSTDLNTLRSNILTSNSEMKAALLEKIADLQKQLVDIEQSSLRALQNQLNKLQNSLDDQGASTSSNLATQNRELSSMKAALVSIESLLVDDAPLKNDIRAKIITLQDQALQIQKTLDALMAIDHHISTLDEHVATGNQHVIDSMNQHVSAENQTMTTLIKNNQNAVLEAVDGLSNQISTVNNNVTTGNRQNQTLGIIGISLGTAAVGAATVPLLMKSMYPSGDSESLESLDTDRESINYVSPGKD